MRKKISLEILQRSHNYKNLRFNIKMTQRLKESILVIIPTFNEEKTIENVIFEIEKQGFNYIIINDASNDKTVKKIKNKTTSIINHPFRMGAWISILTGFLYAYEKEYQIVVTLDADGQHNPQYINRLLQPIINKEADIVIGSFPKRLPWWGKIFLFFIKNFAGLKINDLTSGFRVYNKKVIEFIINSPMDILDYQDIGVLLFLKKRFKIKEVPIIIEKRTYGKSKIFSSTFKILRFALETIILTCSKRSIK